MTVLKSHYKPKPLVIAEVLRDCFVCDLRNEGTQKTEASLSLEKEVEMASGVEQLRRMLNSCEVVSHYAWARSPPRAHQYSAATIVGVKGTRTVTAATIVE